MFLNHRDEFPKLLDHLGVKTAAEIGVAAGWFSKVLLQSTSLEKLYLIDPWLNPADAPYRQKVLDLAAADSRVEILEMTAEQAAERFPDGSLDAVYHDALHEYEFMRETLPVWWSKTRLLYAGHDYALWNHAVNIPVGVMLAVEEFAYLRGQAIYVTGAHRADYVSRLRVATDAAKLPDHGPFGSHFPSWYIFKCES